MGVPRKISIGIVATDNDNWAILYACKQRKLSIKNDNFWIISRKPTLSPDHYQEAKDALKKFTKNSFDFNRLVDVNQSSDTCRYDEFWHKESYN